jgi:hypothetical protein
MYTRGDSSNSALMRCMFVLVYLHDISSSTTPLFEECRLCKSPPSQVSIMGLSMSSFLGLFKKKKKTAEKQNNLHGKSEPIATPSLLSLDIYSHHVHLYSDPLPIISNNALGIQALTPGNDFPHTTSTHLLSGPLIEFLQYSCQEASHWLINIAHDICDPVNRRGSLVIWREQQWLLVTDTDPLTASLYRYDLPMGVTVGLAKISLRAGKSHTSTTGNASTMADHVRQRDGKCWVSQAVRPLVNSHICPKRMGDHTAQIIFATFTSTDPPPNLSIFDEIFGLNLSKTLDDLFDLYQLGFHFVAPVRSSYLLISKIFIDQPFRTFMSAICLLIQMTLWIWITP